MGNLKNTFMAVILGGAAALAPAVSGSSAQAATATVKVKDGKTGKVFNQVVNCNDYEVVNGGLYTTNKVASALDIGNDIRLDSWDLDDIVDMGSLKALSPSLYKIGSGYLQKGYSEAQVVEWAKTQIAAAIEQRLVQHKRDVHHTSENSTRADLKSAAQQCAPYVGRN